MRPQPSSAGHRAIPKAYNSAERGDGGKEEGRMEEGGRKEGREAEKREEMRGKRLY